jgi:hypothetical protein
MDDIRRPQNLSRRDYSVPAHRPGPRPAPPRHAPAHLPSPASMPHAQLQGQPHTPAQPATAPHPHQSHHQPQIQTTARTKPKKRLKLSGKLISVVGGIIIAAAAIFGAGYMLKGSSDSKGIPASITRQVNYDLYFPSPMPSGYTYMKDTATFQIGQVYFKFSHGKKRVTVIEQPMTDPKPNLSKLPSYTSIPSPVGQAAIGTEVGQPTAVVLAPATIITMHTVGGVSPDELKAAVANLKDIGQKPNQ